MSCRTSKNPFCACNRRNSEARSIACSICVPVTAISADREGVDERVRKRPGLHGNIARSARGNGRDIENTLYGVLVDDDDVQRVYTEAAHVYLLNGCARIEAVPCNRDVDGVALS